MARPVIMTPDDDREAEVDEDPRPTSNKATLGAGSNPKSLRAKPRAQRGKLSLIESIVAGGGIDQRFLILNSLLIWRLCAGQGPREANLSS